MTSTEIYKLKLGKYKFSDGIYNNTLFVTLVERRKYFRIVTQFGHAIALYPKRGEYDVDALSQNDGVAVFGKVNLDKFNIVE